MSNSSPSNKVAASTSKTTAAENHNNVAAVVATKVVIYTPSTPLIKRCRPMTDEMILRAPKSKERIARRSENFTSSLCIPQTPTRRSDFEYRSKPLFAADGIKE